MPGPAFRPAGPGASRRGQLDDFEEEYGAATQTWTSRPGQPCGSSKAPRALEAGASTVQPTTAEIMSQLNALQQMNASLTSDLKKVKDAYGASTVGASAVASKTPPTWTSRLAQPYASSRLGQPAASEESYGASTVGALAVCVADHVASEGETEDEELAGLVSGQKLQRSGELAEGPPGTRWDRLVGRVLTCLVIALLATVAWHWYLQELQVAGRPACVLPEDLAQGFTIRHEHAELCYRAGSPGSGVAVFRGEPCGHGQVLWTAAHNPSPQPGLDVSTQCSWERGRNASWDAAWLGSCGQPGLRQLPRELCEAHALDEGLRPLLGVWVDERLREFVVGSTREGLLRLETTVQGRDVWGSLRQTARGPDGADGLLEGALFDAAGAEWGAARLGSVSGATLRVEFRRPGEEEFGHLALGRRPWHSDKGEEVANPWEACRGSAFEAPWSGSEGGLTVEGPRGMRLHKAACGEHQDVEASRLGPLGAKGLSLTFGVARGGGTRHAGHDLRITAYDTEDVSKLFRWCFNGRGAEALGECDEESQVTAQRWHQRTLWFACFQGKHGYLPKQLSIGLDVRSEAENATALVKLLNFHGIGPVRGAVENVVLWAVDDNEEARLRLVESVKTLVRARAQGSCAVRREPLAYAVISVSGNLTCDLFAKAGVGASCKVVTALPGERSCAAANASALAEAPSRQLADGRLHIVRLPPRKWEKIFGATVDAFAQDIFEGQPQSDTSSRRNDLIFSRANHLRFIADRIFLPFGVKQVLHLDNDICVMVPLDELLRTPGSAAVVAARKMDKQGRPITRRDVITMTRDSQAITSWKHGFVYSFNAGVVLLRTERMCQMDLMGRLLEVQRYHNEKGRLWSKGTNQPPFEIAAADSLTMAPWYWNCRLYPGDMEKMRKWPPSQEGSPVAWVKDCKVFHPSTRGTSATGGACAAFSGLGSHASTEEHRKCLNQIFVYDLPWPFDDLKPAPRSSVEWPELAKLDQARVRRAVKEAAGPVGAGRGPTSRELAFGSPHSRPRQAGVTDASGDNVLGNLVNIRMNESRCRAQHAGEADVFVIPLFLAAKTRSEWAAKCRAFAASGGPEKLAALLLPHLSLQTALRHVLFNAQNVPECTGWWAAPLHPALAPVQRAAVRYCYSPPCANLTAPDPRTSEGAIYSVPYPSLVHWSSAMKGEMPWTRVQERPVLMALIAEPRRRGLAAPAKALREALWKACGKSKECQRAKPLAGPNGTEQVYRMYSGAEFCLQPQGLTCERRGILDALLLGCIPVLFSDELCPQDQLWELHWGSWQKDSAVVLELEKVVDGTINVRNALARIPTRRRDDMRTAIRLNGHRLQYSQDDPWIDQPDALAVLFKAIRYGRPAPPPPASRGGEGLTEDGRIARDRIKELEALLAARGGEVAAGRDSKLQAPVDRDSGLTEDGPDDRDPGDGSD